MHSDFANKLRAATEKARETAAAWIHRASARAHKLRPYATQALETVEKTVLAELGQLAAGKLDTKRLDAVRSYLKYRSILRLGGARCTGPDDRRTGDGPLW